MHLFPLKPFMFSYTRLDIILLKLAGHLTQEEFTGVEGKDEKMISQVHHIVHVNRHSGRRVRHRIEL